MSFTPSSLLDVSYLVTFLAGTAVGAAGQYMADRFTDRRRQTEMMSEARKRFFAIQKAMPSLIAEIREHLRRSEKDLIREFVILEDSRVIFNHDRERFEFYEEIHPNIQNEVQMLIDAGYVRDVSTTNHPIYRVSDQFVVLLNET